MKLHFDSYPKIKFILINFITVILHRLANITKKNKNNAYNPSL